MPLTFIDAGVLIAAARGTAEPSQRAIAILDQPERSMDARHVAAALSLGAEEFITTERPDRPIHRVSGIRVHSIYAHSGNT